MTLQLLASSNTVAPSSKIKIEAIGGTAPYVFSLVSGGDGGTILAGGFYKAPNIINKGSQIILVTDANLDTAQVEIFLLSYPQMICELIRSYLGLSADQVYLYNQKITVPKDSRLYIAVKVASSKIFSMTSKFDGVYETIVSHNQSTINIDIFSRSLEAITRKEEVVMALRSHASQRLQMANGFKIAEVPASMNDLSQLEGSAIPYRFNISLNMLYALSIIKTADYYDDIEAVITNEYDDEEHIIIEDED